MTKEELLDKLQEKIIEIHKEAEEALERLDEKAEKNYGYVNNRYDCTLAFYQDITLPAIRLRTRQIVVYEMQDFLDELRLDCNNTKVTTAKI